VTPEHGEVWWYEHPEIGRRPVVLLSRSSAIAARRYAVVAPCSTVHRGLPSEVDLDPRHDPVPRACVVATDSVEGVSVGFLVERIGRLSDDRMREVCVALAVAIACP
jgi:mRNA interferase MazF